MRTSTSIPRIYADDRGLKHGELTDKLIGIFFDIYNELGHGFLESVYEQAFSIALAENEIFFRRQIAVPVWYHEQQIGDFRADLMVEGWEKQLLNYLRATEIEVGLLFNFGPEAQFRRYIFENDRKKIRENLCASAEGK